MLMHLRYTKTYCYHIVRGIGAISYRAPLCAQRFATPKAPLKEQMRPPASLQLHFEQTPGLPGAPQGISGDPTGGASPRGALPRAPPGQL